MKIIKNALYALGTIVLIIKIFFREDISKGFDNVLTILAGVLLLIIIVVEVISRRK